jgi:hypothetical protein
MNIFRQSFFLLSAITVVSPFLIGADDGRVAQCDRISTVVNKAAAETQAISRSNNPDKIAELLRAADTVDRHAKELEAVRVQDAKLKALQASFISMYRDTSRYSRSLVVAAKAQDVEAVKSSLQSLQEATGRESSLVNEFNRYCRGKLPRSN